MPLHQAYIALLVYRWVWTPSWGWLGSLRLTNALKNLRIIFFIYYLFSYFFILNQLFNILEYNSMLCRYLYRSNIWLDFSSVRTCWKTRMFCLMRSSKGSSQYEMHAAHSFLKGEVNPNNFYITQFWPMSP